MIDFQVFYGYNESFHMLNTIFNIHHDKLIAPEVVPEHCTLELIVLE